jgi:hypothetical protein
MHPNFLSTREFLMKQEPTTTEYEQPELEQQPPHRAALLFNDRVRLDLLLDDDFDEDEYPDDPSVTGE